MRKKNVLGIMGVNEKKSLNLYYRGKKFVYLPGNIL